MSQNLLRSVPKPQPLVVAGPPRQTIFLRAHSSLDIQADELLIDVAIGQEQRYPLDRVQSLIAFGDLDLPACISRELLRHQVSVVLFAADGEFLGRLEPNYSDRSDRIRAQSLMSEDQQRHLTQRLVWGALRSYRRLLQRCNREAATRTDRFADAIQRLDWSIEATARIQDQSAASIAALLGSGLSGYYPALASAIRFTGWEWQGRDAKTPLNEMLNLLYVLLEQSMQAAVLSEGLIPAQGIWRSRRDRLGLVKDLAIEFRPFADAVLLRCINRQQVALKDFDGWSRGRLPVTVVEAIVQTYQKKMSEIFTYPSTKMQCSYEQCMSFQSRQVALYLLGAIDEFCPLSIK